MGTVYSGEIVYFRCDYCAEEFHPEEMTNDTSMVLLEAEADGWQHLYDGRYWKYICPDCFETGKYEADGD